jgi:hypothetical protein
MPRPVWMRNLASGPTLVADLIIIVLLACGFLASALLLAHYAVGQPRPGASMRRNGGLTIIRYVPDSTVKLKQLLGEPENSQPCTSAQSDKVSPPNAPSSSGSRIL